MSSSSHLDFDLLLYEKGSEYAALVVQPLFGDAEASFALPFSQAEVERLLPGILTLPRHFKLLEAGGEPPPPETKQVGAKQMDAQGFGTHLYQALLAGAIEVEFVRTLDYARQQGKGVRLRLRFAQDASELSILPWEYLYSPRWGRFIALSEETPLVRYIQVPHPPQPLNIRPPLRILALIADPTDAPRLQVEREWQLLQNALAGLVSAGQVIVERLESPTYAMLQTKLAETPFHALHFVGHGYFEESRNESGLIFENESQRSQPASAQQLAALLHDHAATLRIAVLNACEAARTTSDTFFVGVAQQLVQQEVPAVVAMQFPISDSAALTLAQSFYSALATNEPVDSALTQARKAIHGSTSHTEWATPILFSRSPDNRLFYVEPPLPLLPYEPETLPVAAGSFWMGSDAASNIPAHETPRHTVTLPAYRIGKSPVTNDQYVEFLKRTKHPSPQNVGWFLDRPPQDKGKHPVVGVSWHDAVAYCAWLSAATKRNYRLPTEAEWEKAARGSDGRRYPWGDDWDDQRCNVGSDGTTAVESFPNGASPCGALDMIGNVDEWSSTLWGRSPRQSDFAYPYLADDGRETGRETSRENAQATTYPFRIVRGGSFRNDAKEVRCSARSVYGLGIASQSCGFRVVLEQSPES